MQRADTPSSLGTPVTAATATVTTPVAPPPGAPGVAVPAAPGFGAPGADGGMPVGDGFAAEVGARGVEAGGGASGGVLPSRGSLQVTGSGQSLSVFAVGVDAPELLTAVASRGGVPLVVDETVSRRVTISLRERSAREIIATITGAYGLASAEVEGVTIVSEGIPRSPSSYLLSNIDQISTKYVDAANARNLLPVFLQDYVKVNSEQNAVVLSAPGEVLRKFREDIAGFDLPAAQILVDLLLVELTDTSLDSLGLGLSYSNAGQGISLAPGSGSILYRAFRTLPDAFFVQLNALREQGRARVRANPRIATVSGRRASIFVGRQRYIVTPIDTGQGQRNFIDAGVRLQITPYTGGQSQILVDVDAEVSTLSAIDPLTRLPEKSTRTASTKVSVRDGETIVIGGLRQQETREVNTKIPVLGDVPLLGNLFRTRSQRTTDSELVLFITPRLLSPTGNLPPAEEAALKDRFLSPDLSAPLPAPAFESPRQYLGDGPDLPGSPLSSPPAFGPTPGLKDPDALDRGEAKEREAKQSPPAGAPAANSPALSPPAPSTGSPAAR